MTLIQRSRQERAQRRLPPRRMERDRVTDRAGRASITQKTPKWISRWQPLHRRMETRLIRHREVLWLPRVVNLRLWVERRVQVLDQVVRRGVIPDPMQKTTKQTSVFPARRQPHQQRRPAALRSPRQNDERTPPKMPQMAFKQVQQRQARPRSAVLRPKSRPQQRQRPPTRGSRT